MRWLPKLLIYLGIFVLLYAVFFGSTCIKSPAGRAKVTISSRVIKKLEEACSLYIDYTDQLPGSEGFLTDQTVTTGDPADGIFSTCLYYEHADVISPLRFSFFDSKEQNGLIKSRKGAILVDPWGKPYYIRFDYDYNEEIKAPVTGEVIKDRRFLIWSSGPDGQTGTPETHQDDITSWKEHSE